MKKILIVGKNSYIGENIFNWLRKYPEENETDIVSSINYEWQNKDFSQYSTIINVAGICHINKITEEVKKLYYSINRDLCIDIAKHAKSNNVKQFIYFSSMSVYGKENYIIDKVGLENPTDDYGKSKLQAEKELLNLQSDVFKVCIIRPPFVYGKGCKGNYNILKKIAIKTPIFPNFKNKKSMIFIDNLCEFIRLIINNESNGIFLPQNDELVSTTYLVMSIANVYSHYIFSPKIFNIFIKMLMKINKSANKAFRDDYYTLDLTNYFNNSYNVISFEESIKLTEKGNN